MTLNPVKVQRAANHPDRPGEECKAAPGAFRPVINQHRCEGKGDCVEVCPYDVFAVERMDDATFAGMPFMVKVKLWAHGKKTALTPHADACRACGLCVVACPEGAIRLEAVK